MLKYAPIKTDFVRALAADETIKSNISENMVDLPDETVTIEAEAQTPQEEEISFDPPTLTVDEETGEVLTDGRN